MAFCAVKKLFTYSVCLHNRALTTMYILVFVLSWMGGGYRGGSPIRRSGL